MRLILVRHTQVAVPKGTLYGQADVELASSSATDFAAVHKRLPTQCDFIYSSPLSRCRLLAESLAVRYGTQPEFDEDLLEMNFGHWEGKRWNELPAEQARHWGNHWQSEPAPGGESFQHVRSRVAQFRQQRLIHDEYKTVIVVAHSGPLRCLCLQIHPQYRVWPEHRAFEIPLDYGGVIEFRYSG